MLGADVGKSGLHRMPIARTGECGNHCRNWASEDTWKVGFTRESGRERERFAPRCELSVEARFVPAWLDPQESVVRHQDADQSVKNEYGRPVAGTQTLVAESGRNVRRAQEGDEQVAFGVAKTGPLAENLGSAQSNPSPPHVAGVGDGVAHPIEKD